MKKISLRRKLSHFLILIIGYPILTCAEYGIMILDKFLRSLRTGICGDLTLVGGLLIMIVMAYTCWTALFTPIFHYTAFFIESRVEVLVDVILITIMVPIYTYTMYYRLKTLWKRRK